MNNSIPKLSKLNNPESFFQINTIKGYKYIDKAGEIVNYYYHDDIAPVFDMGLNGLIIRTPKDKIYELKVTPQLVWMKFTQTDSLDMVSNLFEVESKAILKILGIDAVSRVGWRNYFIYEFGNKAEDREKYLKNITKIKNGLLSFIKIDIDTKKDFKAVLMIQPVIKNDSEKTSAILFDIDIYQTGKIKIDNIGQMLNNFKDYMRDEKGFLSVVNETFIKAE